jgi:CHAD domain-containing protein
MFAECFAETSVARWQKEIRKLTKGLGRARDKDVQVGFLCGVLQTLENPDHCPGIAQVMVRLQRKRDALQSKVVAAVDRLETSGALDHLKSTMKGTVEEMLRRRVPIYSETVARRTEDFITLAIEEFLQYQSSLDDPQDIERHHAMRIAAKQLRYTMELCKRAYDGRLDEPIATVKQLQTLLGDLHDCDVWVEHLGKLLDKERRRVIRCYGHEDPLARIAAGVVWLQDDRRQRREQLFAELVRRWQDLGRDHFWDNLMARVKRQEQARDIEISQQQPAATPVAAEVAQVGHGS